MERKPEPLRRLDVLARQIRDRIAAQPDIPEAAHGQLAVLLDYMPVLRVPQNWKLVPLAEASAAALLLARPNDKLAAEINRRICAKITEFIPGVWVVWGLVVLLGVVVPSLAITYAYLVSSDPPPKFLEMPVYDLLRVILFGTLGGVISILIRIRDFVVQEDTTWFGFFTIGCFRPVIGVAFALFAYVAVSGSLVPFRLPDAGEKALYTYAALAFVCGFSERLGGRLVAQTEQITETVDREVTPPRAEPETKT